MLSMDELKARSDGCSRLGPTAVHSYSQSIPSISRSGLLCLLEVNQFQTFFKALSAHLPECLLIILISPGAEVS